MKTMTWNIDTIKETNTNEKKETKGGKNQEEEEIKLAAALEVAGINIAFIQETN